MTKTFTAKTVEEAKELAVKEFGVDESSISFNVLEEPKKSLFGKLKGEAKIEATVEIVTKSALAKSYIIDVFKSMGYDVEIEVQEQENGAILNISGEGVEAIIGKKGELLDSLQYLSSLVCNKIDRDYFRITTDCNGFRDKRKSQLEKLADKVANNVKRNGRTTALEPMNPYERRIIHSVVTEIEGVTSRSKGEEPYRKVIISSTEKKRYNNNDGYKKRNNRRPINNVSKKPYDIVSSFEKEYKKPKPEDDMVKGSGLYSKIDL